jgi:hypothetical protein
MVNLATSLMHEGHYEAAEKLQRETIETRRRVLGPDNPDTALATYNLAVMRYRLGHRDETLQLLGEAVDHGLSPGNCLAMATDPDFKSLQGDHRFDALVAHAKERALAARR